MDSSRIIIGGCAVPSCSLQGREEAEIPRELPSPADETSRDLPVKGLSPQGRRSVPGNTPRYILFGDLLVKLKDTQEVCSGGHMDRVFLLQHFGSWMILRTKVQGPAEVMPP